MKKTIAKIFILLLLASCGFTSGLYEDILKAQELTRQHKFEQADKLYKKIIAKKPSLNIKIKVYFQLGEINSVFLNKSKEAINYYNKVIDISSDPLWHVKSIEKIAYINFENLKNYDEAIKSYNKLITFIPHLERYSEYKFSIAESYFLKRDFKKALKLFEEFKDNSKFYETYKYIGLVHFYRSQWKMAIDNWFEYLKREKQKNKIVQVKFLIANAYESDEQLKNAYNIYYSLLGDYPNQEVLKSRLKSIYERRVARKR